MKYEVLCHACVRIEGSKILYFDPFKIEGEPHDADYIFITHSHYDHESPEDIEKVKNAGTVIVSYKDIKPGDEISFNGFVVKAVAAYNKNKPFHAKSNGWVGYLVSLDGMDFYVAGDTDNTPEARAVRCDVCFIPVGGTYTCSAKQAAELANAIAPRVEAVPYHYGCIVGSSEDAELFRSLLETDFAAK